MMSKKAWITALIFIFAIGIFTSLWIIFKPYGDIVHIVQDNQLLYEIDLEKSDDHIIEIEYQGKKNVIQIENHEICVIEADCPDKICVKTGKLKSTPIVCLPNRLVIEFAEKNDFH